MTSDLKHEVIAASAGSGKTTALAVRFLRLLALGVAPERIIALTFSRKAAREMFDKILTLLAEAATKPAPRPWTQGHRELQALAPADYLGLLRRLLSRLHLVRVGTLDSFNVAVMSAFPLEFGLAGELSLLLPEQEQQARQQALAAVFLDLADEDQARRDFVQAFKQASYGQEEKRFAASLDRFVAGFHQHLRAAPHAESWGQPVAIWPAGCPWFVKGDDPALLAQQLLALLAPKLKPKQADRFSDAAQALATWQAPAPMPAPLSYLLTRLLAALPDLEAGDALVTIERPAVAMQGDAARLAASIVRQVVGSILAGRVLATQSLFRILDHYERAYDVHVRRQGQLTFSDLSWLLGAASSDATAPRLTQNPAVAIAGEARLHLDFRLDGQYDHWLLDEFQDTSDSQWAVLANLIDEVAQDDSGRRTFFYVGDVKQAIHGWRGGNAGLFDQLLARYNPDPAHPRVHQRELNDSYRSAPAIIEVVNTIFTRLPDHPDLPAPVCQRWRTLWREHCSARPERAGYVRALEVAGKEQELLYDAVADLLREIDPAARGLSVGLLVRTNEVGRGWVEALRARLPTLAIAWEGGYSVVDNQLATALLAVLQAAAHPGDTLAWQHLAMTPVAAYLETLGTSAAARHDRLAREVLAELHLGGFRGVLATWAARLTQALPAPGLGAFGQQRLDAVLNAAAAFDATGNRDVLAFQDFLRSHLGTELDTASTVRVMTMHRAKGLQFHAVILPHLQGDGLTSAGLVDFALHHPPGSAAVDWALLMPPRELAAADSVLGQYLTSTDEAYCHEALCLLYVALTRAMQGLYLVGKPPGKTIDHYQVLRHTLGADETAASAGEPAADDEAAAAPVTVWYEHGDAQWFTQHPIKAVTDAAANAATTGPAPAVVPTAAVAQRTRLQRVLPSHAETKQPRAADLFKAESSEATDFGTALHALFEAIGWYDAAGVDDAIATWRSTFIAPPERLAAVEQECRRALAAPAVQRALACPAPGAELWREQRFEIVLDQQWISGCFDRVTITRDAAGHATHAVILDYKSNRVDDPDALRQLAAGYARQLRLYRHVLARMLALPVDRITSQLLFTKPARAVAVE